jgi:hypothetical protein
MPSEGVRTFRESAWHYCGRCKSKADLNRELQWQYGMLLCQDCIDVYPILLGAIEAQQAKMLQTIDVQPDLRPHEKLTKPTEQITNDDIYA